MATPTATTSASNTPNANLAGTFSFGSYSSNEPELLFDGCTIDLAKLQKLRRSVLHAATAIERKLGDHDATPLNILKVFWNRDVFSLLADNFQMEASKFKEEPTFIMWSKFLSVVLRGSFFNCSSFEEMYEFDEEFQFPSKIMAKDAFMAMKRGLSAMTTPVDSQKIINVDFDEDHTIDVQPWELLMTKTSSIFINSSPMVMIEADRYATQADEKAYSTQRNPKKGRTGPLADVACTADLRLIVAVSLRRSEENAMITSFSRLIDRLDGIGSKPSVVFPEQAYPAFPVSRALYTKGVSQSYPATKIRYGPSSCLDTMANIESDRKNNLNLSQLICLRFLNYLLYNSYVLHRVLSVKSLFIGFADWVEHDPKIERTFVAFQKQWKDVSIRSFVLQVDRSIREKGGVALLPDIFGGVNHEACEDSDDVPIVQSASGTAKGSNFIRWPKRARREASDKEPWKSQRLSKEASHHLVFTRKARPCVACTVYEGRRPTQKHSSNYVCVGCDNIPLCRRPPKDGKSKSCSEKWHNNDRVNI